MITAHKICLQPTNDQLKYFYQAAGIARFSYNWALANWQDLYKKGEKPNEKKLRKLLNSIKKEKFPWMKDVSKNVVQQSIKNLGTAFSNFFNPKLKAKYPTFKTKRKCKDSFRIDNGTDKNNYHAVKVNGNQVNIPLLGWVKMTENIRFPNYKILSAVISRTADKWFISFILEIPDKPIVRENQTSVGVDLGLKTFATLSSNKIITKIEAPRPAKISRGKIRRLNKSLSRKQKGSNNEKKAVDALAKQYARDANIRKDFIHKLTTFLINTYGVIGIETLSVKGMQKIWGKSINDLGLYEFRRQLEYKWKNRGNLIVEADKWFASSKLCNLCGWKNEDLTLKDREWVCESCGIIHDRDGNGAINLENLAASIAVSACGAIGSGIFRHEICETSCDEARNLVVDICL